MKEWNGAFLHALMTKVLCLELYRLVHYVRKNCNLVFWEESR